MNHPERILRTLDAKLDHPMMRVDPQDRADLLVLLKTEPLTLDQAKDLFRRAQIPDIAEIRDAFEQNCQWILDQIANDPDF